MIGVVDCNNFFASCEEVFRPKLRGKPLVVLSNNDGIIIARSKSAKQLGIQMGAPAFQYRDLFRNQNVEVCSSNFSLYADMSRRVMETLALKLPSIERYSIDEVFFEMESITEEFALDVKKTVYKWTGIPVSIGVARTKVLAKLAVEEAKSQPNGVCILLPIKESAFLKSKALEDIWGIGSQYSKKLHAHGLYTAYDLTQLSMPSLQKLLNVVGQRIVLELKGESILELEEVRAPRKSISTARSFPSPLNQEEEIAAVLAAYVARIAHDLREEGLVASIIQVWLVTSDFQSRDASVALPQKTAYTPSFVQIAKKLLNRIFNPQLSYRKVGVLLSGLEPTDNRPDLFLKKNDREVKLMEVVDGLNRKMGKGSIQFASMSKRPPQEGARSERATTHWDELPQVN